VELKITFQRQAVQEYPMMMMIILVAELHTIVTCKCPVYYIVSHTNKLACAVSNFHHLRIWFAKFQVEFVHVLSQFRHMRKCHGFGFSMQTLVICVICRSKKITA
jgi:hypothetical protein